MDILQLRKGRLPGKKEGWQHDVQEEKELRVVLLPRGS